MDEQLGSEDEIVAPGDQVERLPHLDACISEGLCLLTTPSLGLPRIVSGGEMTILGHFFPEGTVLSVPSYTIHRDTSIWGEDVEEYRPERWFERDPADIKKTFNLFSVEPRFSPNYSRYQLLLTYRPLGVVLVAIWEVQIIIASQSILRRYDIVLENPDDPYAPFSISCKQKLNLVSFRLQTREGFILGCRIGGAIL